MPRIKQDLRFAFRALVRGRFVTALALLAFALGIGITTAVFSMFHGVLLRPLPFPNPDEIVLVYDTQPACPTCPASFPKYHDWRTRNQVFAAIGGSMSASFVLTGAGEPEQVPAVRTTASLVDVFAVPPMLGRWYSPEEDRPGAARVAVLSHPLWSQRFAADPGILGRTIRLDGEAHEVIGVMPQGFTHRNAQVFTPLAREIDPSTRGSHFLVTYARLKRGIAVERAATEMRALGRTLAAEFGHNHGIDVRSFREAMVGDVRAPLRVLLGAVILVLLIACANVANLLLASGLARRRELAIRLALGASHGALVRQLAAEGVLLALGGGLIGVLLAVWGVRVFAVLAEDQLPRAAAIGIDGQVLAFAAAVSLLVGVACGLWPLVRLRTHELAATVREADTRTATGGGSRFGNGLVIAEIAVAVALLVGGGLLVKNLLRLHARDAGIRTERIVALDVAPAGPRYEAPGQVKAFYREVYERLRASGGVESAGLVSHLPMYRFGMNGEMSIEGQLPWGPSEAPLVEYRWIHGEYFRTLGIPLLRGRLLDGRDGEGSTTVLVNQAMAVKFWPGEDPIGKRFGQGSDRSAWWEVVGVVGDVRSFGLARNTPYEFYRTIDQRPYNAMTIVVRSSGPDPMALVPAVRQIVGSVDPAMPVSRVQTMERVVADSVGRPRLLSALTGLFGALAGLLALVGVYGVMAYNVRRQRREFGIRLALGADNGRVRALVVRRGLALGIQGVAIGAVGAWLLTGSLHAMLHDVEPTDPWVFGAIAAGVLVAVTVASYLPARAAGGVDPIVVLRDG